MMFIKYLTGFEPMTSNWSWVPNYWAGTRRVLAPALAMLKASWLVSAFRYVPRHMI